LLWAWDGISKTTIIGDIAAAADAFARLTVAHLTNTGWTMIGNELFCPDCALRNTSAISHGPSPP
jgi:hypothetical protein